MKRPFLLAALLVASAALAQAPQLEHLGIDTARATIPVGEILSGGPPPQHIPALGFAGDWRGATKETPAPGFVSQEDAAGWLGAQEPVIAINLNGEAKAYPL